MRYRCKKEVRDNVGKIIFEKDEWYNGVANNYPTDLPNVDTSYNLEYKSSIGLIHHWWFFNKEFYISFYTVEELREQTN